MISRWISVAALLLKRGLATACAALGITPNLLTAISLVPMILAATAMAEGRLVSAGLWVILGGACDLLDGAVARATGHTTPFGGVLDSIVDRASDTALLVGTGLYFYARDEPTYVALSTIALGGSLSVSYARARAENVIPNCRVGFAERGERIVILLLGLFFGRLHAAVTILAPLSWLTTLQRLIHTKRVLNRQEKNIPRSRSLIN